jgi:hypothetical protein
MLLLTLIGPAYKLSAKRFILASIIGDNNPLSLGLLSRVISCYV